MLETRLSKRHHKINQEIDSKMVYENDKIAV